MDRHFVTFSGRDLIVEKLINLFDELETTYVARVGQTHFWAYGEERHSPRQIQFEENTITFVSQSDGLIDFLRTIERARFFSSQLGIAEVCIHSHLEREGQINGELSHEEVSLIAASGANYTWSVDFTEG